MRSSEVNISVNPYDSVQFGAQHFIKRQYENVLLSCPTACNFNYTLIQDNWSGELDITITYDYEDSTGD